MFDLILWGFLAALIAMMVAAVMISRRIQARRNSHALTGSDALLTQILEELKQINARLDPSLNGVSKLDKPHQSEWQRAEHNAKHDNNPPST
jgi:uncharacterized protein YlxW (UPF0749 family)